MIRKAAKAFLVIAAIFAFLGTLGSAVMLIYLFLQSPFVDSPEEFVARCWIIAAIVFAFVIISLLVLVCRPKNNPTSHV
jgi:hypothetical protein